MYKIEGEKLDFGFYGDFRVIAKLEKEKEPLLKIKEKFDLLVKRLEGKMSGYYSKNEGRPAYPIGKPLGMLLIKCIYGLKSDRIVYRVCLTDALFRYFIGCNSFNEPIPDDTTLVKFRKRLGEDGFREIFNEVVNLANEVRKITPFRIIDATHINAIGRKFGFIKFIREGINRTIKAILVKNEEFAKKLKVKFQKVKIKTENETKKLGEKFLKEVSRLKELPPKVKEILSAVKLSLKGEPMVNFFDREARWGHKSEDFLFGGYKAEILSTKDGIITSYRTLPGNVNEGKDISPLIEDERNRGLKIKEIVGDRLYPSGKNFEYLRNAGIKGHFPKRTKLSNVDKFYCEGDKIVCPFGKKPIGKISQENGKLFYWSTKDCIACPFKHSCLSPSECRKRVYLSDLKAMKIEERRDKLKNRSAIERVFAHAVKHGLRDSWYRGLSKTTIHLGIIFTLLNLEYLANAA